MHEDIFLEFCRKVKFEKDFDKKMWQNIYEELIAKHDALPLEEDAVKKALRIGEEAKELTDVMSFFSSEVEDPDQQYEVLEAIADLSNVFRE